MRYTNPRTHSLSLTHSPWRLVRSWRRSLRCGQVCRRSDNRPSPRRCITPGRTAGSSTTAGTPQVRTLHATQFTGCFFVLVFFFYFTFFARQQSRLTSAFERTQIVYRVAETTLSVHSHYPCARMLLLNTRIYDPWTRVVLEPLCHVYTDCVVGRRRTSPLYACRNTPRRAVRSKSQWDIVRLARGQRKQGKRGCMCTIAIQSHDVVLLSAAS